MSFLQRENLILKIYKSYKQNKEIIDEYNYVATQLKKKKMRRQNFPEIVSEFIVEKLENFECKKKGDLWDKNKKIEVKAFSSTGPISFGPSEKWNAIYFVDAINNPKIKVYKCEISFNSEDWQTIQISKTETFKDQIKQKRRPRICWEKLKKQIKYELCYKGNIEIFLSENEE